MVEALAEPPPGHPPRVERPLLLRSPYVQGHHRPCPHPSSQGWVVLHPQVPSEPYYASLVAAAVVAAAAAAATRHQSLFLSLSLFLLLQITV